MDLPIELRLRIVEYALATSQPLYWTWLTYTPSLKFGTFKHLSSLAAISRVSRQLHAETRSVVWQVNRFEFVESCFGIGYHATILDTRLTDQLSSLHFSGLLKACRVFLQNAPAGCFKHKHAIITLRCTFPLGVAAQTKCFKALDKLCAMYPVAQFKLEVYHWYLTTPVRDGSCDPLVWDTSTFVNKGRDLQAAVSACGFGSRQRGWRLFPGFNGDPKVLEEDLSGEELDMALRWFEDGL